MTIKGNVLRVTYTDFFPMTNFNCSRIPITRDSNRCLMPGIAVEIINLIVKHLNMTIEADHRLDSLEDYSFVFDDLANNKTDTYALLFEDVASRRKNFDFSDPLYQIDSHIAVRRAEHSLKNIFDFFTVYKWEAWLSMFMVFIFFTLFGSIVRFVECQLNLRSEVKFFDILWKMVRFQLIQSSGIEYNLRAGRTSLLVFSIFQLCIILGLFQGYILTSVVKNKNPIPFDGIDFPRLLKEGKFHIVTATMLDWYYQAIENSYESPFYEIREAMKSNPYRMAKTTPQVLEIVNEGNGAVMFAQDDHKLRFLASRYCDLVFIDSQMQPGYERLMFRKGHPLIPRINEAIHENTALIQRIARKYLQYRPPLSCHSFSNKPKPLSIRPYYGILIIFFIGISTACFMFGGELLRFCYRKSNKCTVNIINEYNK